LFHIAVLYQSLLSYLARPGRFLYTICLCLLGIFTCLGYQWLVQQEQEKKMVQLTGRVADCVPAETGIKCLYVANRRLLIQLDELPEEARAYLQAGSVVQTLASDTSTIDWNKKVFACFTAAAQNAGIQVVSCAGLTVNNTRLLPGKKRIQQLAAGWDTIFISCCQFVFVFVLVFVAVLFLGTIYTLGQRAAR
jgi:hypothetical protein